MLYSGSWLSWPADSASSEAPIEPHRPCTPQIGRGGGVLSQHERVINMIYIYYTHIEAGAALQMYFRAH